MTRDVEIADAERKVHRIDIFELRRENEQVSEEKQARESRERVFHFGKTIKRGAGAGRRSGCPDDSREDRW